MATKVCDAEECKGAGNGRSYLVPAIVADGGESPPILFLCLDCLRDRGWWCDTHGLPHTSFQNGGHACLPCIEDGVRSDLCRATPLAERLRSSLSTDSWEELEDWADMVGGITGDINRDVTILRALVTAAQRRQITVDQVVDEVCAAKTATALLPPLI